MQINIKFAEAECLSLRSHVEVMLISPFSDHLGEKLGPGVSAQHSLIKPRSSLMKVN